MSILLVNLRAAQVMSSGQQVYSACDGSSLDE